MNASPLPINYDHILTHSSEDKANWPYTKEAEYSVVSGTTSRVIRKYKISDLSGNTVKAAAAAVLKLLNENSMLIPIFDLNKVEKTVQRKMHLTINDRALCLSNKPEIHYMQSRFLDHFFAGVLIKRPYKCDENYLLDLESMEYWRKKEHRCPCLKHLINPAAHLVYDDYEMKKLERLNQHIKEENEKDIQWKQLLADAKEIDRQLSTLSDCLQKLCNGTPFRLRKEGNDIFLENPTSFTPRDIAIQFMLPCIAGMGLVTWDYFKDVTRTISSSDVSVLVNYSALAGRGFDVFSETKNVILNRNSKRMEIFSALLKVVGFAGEVSLMVLPIPPQSAAPLRAAVISIGTACIVMKMVKANAITEQDVADLANLGKHFAHAMGLPNAEQVCGLLIAALQLRKIYMEEGVIKRIVSAIIQCSAAAVSANSQIDQEINSQNNQ